MHSRALEGRAARDRPSREAGEEQVGEEVREGECSDSQVENQERRQSQCKGLRDRKSVV